MLDAHDRQDIPFAASSWLEAISSYWKTSLAGVLLLTFVALCAIYPFSVRGNQFNTPDEGANYFFTRLLAETGKLWYTTELTPEDEENLLHPRAALTYDDRVVPQYYFGLPVLYAPLYSLVGDDIQYLSIVFAIACAWAIYRIAVLSFDAEAWQVGAALVACTPLIYYLNRSFMNVAPAVTFALVGAWLLTRYVKFDSRLSLVGASSLFALSMFCRYEYVLFLGPVLLASVFYKHRTYLTRRASIDSFLAMTIVFALFLAPVLALNKVVYGDWTTYGLSIFNDAFYPERSPSTAASSFVEVARTVRSILLPSYDIDLGVLARNLLRLTLLLMPAFTIAAFLGVAVLFRRGALKLWPTLAVLALVAYFLTYRASSDFWNAGSLEPSFDVSFVRYWLFAYLGLLFLVVYALRSIQDRATTGFLVVALLISGPVSVYSATEGSLSWLTNAVKSNQKWAQSQLVPNTEENAIVYSGRHDKAIAPYREVAAWWNGEEFYDPSALARSMARTSNAGRPVYLYSEPEINMDELQKELARFNLQALPAPATNLLRIGPIVLAESADVSSLPTAIDVNRSLLLDVAFTHTEGANQIRRLDAAIGDNPDWRQGCWLAYLADQNLLFIVTTAGEYRGAGVPGGNGIAVSEQCALHARGTSVLTDGNKLSVTFEVTVKEPLVGANSIYSRAQEATTGGFLVTKRNQVVTVLDGR